MSLSEPFIRRPVGTTLLTIAVTIAGTLSYLLLPVLTLAIPALATIVRFTRSGVLNVMSGNSVFYQVAMGLPRRRVVWKYILRAALIGTLTQIGLVFGNLLIPTRRNL